MFMANILFIFFHVKLMHCLQFIQWSINKTGRKLAELPIHAEASGPFVTIGAGGQKQMMAPRGKLLAWDTDGSHLLTCASKGGLIYRVRTSFVCYDVDKLLETSINS